VKGAPGKNRALARLLGRGSDPAEWAEASWTPGWTGALGPFWLYSKEHWHCSARRARDQKSKARVDRSSTRSFAFPWRGSPGRKPVWLAELSRTPATTEPSTAKAQVEHKNARRSLIYARFWSLIYARFWSLIYARFCVCLARRAGGKQPRRETSVAGAALWDSGHNRAQRDQKPARTQNRA
jgi:hypothetical protein